MNNQKLENMLDAIKKEPEKGFPKEFSELLNQTVFQVPALLPPDTDPKIMSQMIRQGGKNRKLPEGVNPHPCLLENGKGEKFLPVFTSSEQMEGGAEAPKFPLTLNIPFPDCVKMLKQNVRVKGAVINPFSHNVVVPVNMAAEEQKKEITIDEYHILTRQKFESNILPVHLFLRKGELAKKISKEKGEYLKDLYEEAYNGEIACPYVPEDFDFISMQITDDLLVVQITMPAKYAGCNTASFIIYAWDQKQEKIWYYAVIKAPGSAPAVLVEKLEDKSLVRHGTAPEEGSILTEIIRLIQGE